MKDLHNQVEVRRVISPVSGAGDNTAQVGQIVDHANFDSVEYAILLGAIADADATFTVLLEHGDVANLSDAAAVPDSELLGTEVGAAFAFDSDNTQRKLGYIGAKRYSRLTLTPVNNTGAWLVAACAVLSQAHKQPRSSQTS